MEAMNQNETVAYDGLCAFAISTGKMDVKGGKHSITVRGKTYLFSNPVAKILFKLLPNRIEKAEQNWEKR